MPDRRKHRGPHPEDQTLFGVESMPALRAAVRDLSWLLTRQYASTSAVKLVGDRYSLSARQRVAIARCACSDHEVASRHQRQLQREKLQNQELWIDGYNVLTSVEAALSSAVILLARDGCYRDMASMHGSYRKVEETIPAITILGDILAAWEVNTSLWFLDAPVSNSGRLKTILREVAEQRGWIWSIELVPDPDVILAHTDHIVASADRQILDKGVRWFNLARVTIDSRIPNAWILNLAESDR